MSELISGKEALIALANGEDVECRAYENNWINIDNKQHPLSLFFDDFFQFRLKPRTITINGIEVNNMFDAFLTISNAYDLSPEKWCEIRKILNP